MNKCSRYKRMRSSRIKQDNCRGIIDEERTKHDVRGFLGILHCNMVDPGSSVVLPSSVGITTSSIVGCRGWSLVVAVGILGRLGTVVGIVTLLSTVETGTGGGAELVGVGVVGITLCCLLTTTRGLIVVVGALRGVEILAIVGRPLLVTLLSLLGLLGCTLLLLVRLREPLLLLLLLLLS